MVAASVHSSSAHPAAHHRSASSSTATAAAPAGPSHKKRSSQPAPPRRSTDQKTHRAKRKSVEIPKQSQSGGDDDSMASGFIQFCATCETQIVVPSASILYCSERCRRQDSGLSPPASPALKVPATTSVPDDDMDIIPPLSPTVRKQHSFFGPGSPAHDDESATGPKAETRPSYDRSTSDAARFLSQFHHGDRPGSARPRSSRHSAVPSLSHTPSSASSSVPYTTVSHIERPLPSSRSLVGKSVDLVTPSAAGADTSPDSMDTLKAQMTSLQLSPHRSFQDSQDDEDMYENALYDDAPSSYYEKRSYPDGRTPTAQSSLRQLLESGRDKA